MPAGNHNRPGAMSPQDVANQNAGLRMALLQSAPRMRKNVITSSAAVGGTSRLKLFNVGVLTKLLLRVTLDLTIGTAIAVPSFKAPWNLISRVRLTDYDGTDRVNLSGFQLWVLNCIRVDSFYGSNNAVAITQVLTNPVVPTAIGNGQVAFFIEVPVAFDVDNQIVQLQDLRGAIMCQTAVGEMYLNIDWISSLVNTTGDVDSLYQGAGTTTVVGQNTTPITVTMWQDYLLPQAIGNRGQIPIPGIDIMTVYELNGNVRSSDNIALNTEKLINYPNVRSVIGAYFNYVTGAQVRVIANGNNILMDNSGFSQLFYQRELLQTDLLAGNWWRLHREHPIETALFGNVQAGLTPNVVTGGNQYIEIAFESFYTKGQALPGIGQSN
jgi:hypothetical protein